MFRKFRSHDIETMRRGRSACSSTSDTRTWCSTSACSDARSWL